MADEPAAEKKPPFWWPSGRDVVVAAIFALFFYAYGRASVANDKESIIGFNGAILTAFAAAWGYHLGSSKGAAENRAVLNNIAAQPSVSAPSATTQTINVQADKPTEG